MNLLELVRIFGLYTQPCPPPNVSALQLDSLGKEHKWSMYLQDIIKREQEFIEKWKEGKYGDEYWKECGHEMLVFGQSQTLKEYFAKFGLFEGDSSVIHYGAFCVQCRKRRYLNPYVIVNDPHNVSNLVVGDKVKLSKVIDVCIVYGKDALEKVDVTVTNEL